MDPKLKSVNKVEPPYKLNQLSQSMLHSVAKDLVIAKFVTKLTDFKGEEWERSFAKAIGAEWKPSNVGLDDVVLGGGCCWGAKTIKHQRPFQVQRVPLISGRNSIDYSFDESDARKLEPVELAQKVLAIWNARVTSVREKFAHVRTIVLIKGPSLTTAAIFEVETVRYDYSEYTWQWHKGSGDKKGQNLWGFDEFGMHKFTWQPHGSQFTIQEEVPTPRHMITIKPTTQVHEARDEELLASLGYSDSWVTLDSR